jgi:hypothetical protein
MLRSIVAKIFMAPSAEHHAVMAKEARLPHLGCFRPVSGAIGADLLPSRARHTDMVIATTTAAIPPEAAM